MSAPARSRLPLLIVVLAAVVGIRWWDPIEHFRGTAAGTGDLAIAQAVVRAPATSTVSPRSTSPLAAPTESSNQRDAFAGDLFAGTREPQDGPVIDAFQVRQPPAPPPPPPPPPAPKVAAVVALPPPPAPPAPPLDTGPPPPALQVIGTWRDERGLSVFLAGPQGVVMARAGDTLLSQYTVTQVLPQQLLLKHLPSNRDLTLAIPVAAATPPRPIP